MMMKKPFSTDEVIAVVAIKLREARDEVAELRDTIAGLQSELSCGSVKGKTAMELDQKSILGACAVIFREERQAQAKINAELRAEIDALR